MSFFAHLTEVETVFVWLKHKFAAAVFLLVQTFRILDVNFCIQTILDSHFQCVVLIGSLVAAAVSMIMRVSVWHVFLIKTLYKFQ